MTIELFDLRENGVRGDLVSEIAAREAWIAAGSLCQLTWGRSIFIVFLDP